MPVAIMRNSNFDAKPGGGGNLESLLSDVMPTSAYYRSADYTVPLLKWTLS